MAATFEALKHRNFRLFFFGQLFSLMGSWVQTTAQQWLVLLLTSPRGLAGESLTEAVKNPDRMVAANSALATVAALGSLPLLLGALWGGSIADRLPKRRIILAALVMQGLLAAVMSVLIVSGHVTVPIVMVFAVLLGITNVFEIPTRQAFLVEMVGKEDLPNAVALQSSIFNMARALGPALAGLLLATLSRSGAAQGLALCFLLNALSYLCSIAGFLAMRGPFLSNPATRESPLKAMGAIFVYLKASPLSALVMSLVTLFSLASTPYFVLFASLARFTLHADELHFGILYSAQGAGALLAALVVATLAHQGKRGVWILTCAVLNPLLTLILLGVCQTYGSTIFPLATLLVVVISFTAIGFLANANTFLQTMAPDHLRGRLMGLYAMSLMGLTPIGSIWGGLVARSFGAPVAMGVGAMGALLILLIAMIRYAPLLKDLSRVNN